MIEVISISEIAGRDYPATREELEIMWRQYVDPQTPKPVLSLISEKELRRMVVICVCKKNKRSSAFGRVILQITRAVGIHKTTGYDYWREACAKR